MKETKFNGTVSLSFPSSGNYEQDDGRYASIAIHDKDSNGVVAEVSLTMKDFALLISGLAHVSAFDARSTVGQNLGKKKVIEERVAVYPKSLRWDKKKVADFILKNCAEEGWTPSLSLSSQNTFGVNEAGENIVRYSVHRYE